MNITLKHLRAFVEVARQGSFTRAAGALFVSQPALTVIINQFEEFSGLRLFDRTTRRVWLTKDGRDFLPSAERVVEEFDAAVLGLSAVAERRRGRVTLATLPSVAIRLLPGILKKFTERHPAISVHLHDSNASGVQRRVERGEVDFGIASRWEDNAELRFEALLRDRFGLVCRPDHPLAKSGEPLAWSELAGYPFLGLARDTGIWPLLNGIDGLPDSVRRPLYEVANIATLEGMLQAGLGITVLPELALPRAHAPALMFRPLVGPALRREICVIRRHGRSLSPAAQRMLELIQAESGADRRRPFNGHGPAGGLSSFCPE